MTFEEFKKENNIHYVECECCAFCKHFKADPYEVNGNCTHPDAISADDVKRYGLVRAAVDDFQLCDKFCKH